MPQYTMTVATAVAIASLRPVVSATARELALDAIIDTLAGMVAGRRDTSVQAVQRAFAVHGSGGEARLITGGCSNPMLAAIINATAAHALDFDDNFMPGMSHASAVIVPAILALADFDTTSGSRTIDAYLAGLQAQALIGSGLGQAHYTAGWHGTSTVGSIGTAAATAVMLELSTDETACAITIATSLASGTKGQFGTMIKPFHAGLAARNAVEASLLAKGGMRAKADILEGEQGLHELFAGDPAKGWHITDILAEGLHVIETVGVMPKRHPCCGSTHLVVDALLDLMQSHSFGGADVTGVECKVGIANFRNLPYQRPVDEMQARFSMQYCVARALRQGFLALADFTPAAVAEHSGDPLLNAITMHCYSAEEEQDVGEKLAHQLSVTLKDGRTLQAERQYAVGTLMQPFSVEDKYRKYNDCCQTLDEASFIYQQLQTLDRADSLAALRPLFA